MEWARMEEIILNTIIENLHMPASHTAAQAVIDIRKEIGGCHVSDIKNPIKKWDGYSVARQPPPAPTSGAEVYDLVRKDLEQRYIDGKNKYGVQLRVGNGRDPLVDLYQELIDAVFYCRQAIEELNKKGSET